MVVSSLKIFWKQVHFFRPSLLWLFSFTISRLSWQIYTNKEVVTTICRSAEKRLCPLCNAMCTSGSRTVTKKTWKCWDLSKRTRRWRWRTCGSWEDRPPCLPTVLGWDLPLMPAGRRKRLQIDERLHLYMDRGNNRLVGYLATHEQFFRLPVYTLSPFLLLHWIIDE